MPDPDTAALTPSELDARVDALLQPGVAGTWPEHDWKTWNPPGGRASICKRCEIIQQHEAPLTLRPCHVAPLRWASAEPGTDEAHRLAGRMLEELVKALAAKGVRGVQVHASKTAIYTITWWEGRTYRIFDGEGPQAMNVALARALLAAQESTEG